MLAGCGQSSAPPTRESTTPAGSDNPPEASTGPSKPEPRIAVANQFGAAALQVRIQSGDGTIQHKDEQSSPLAAGQTAGTGTRVTTNPASTIDLISKPLGLAFRLMPNSDVTVTGLTILEPEQAISAGTHINAQLELSKGSMVVVAPNLTPDSALQVWTSSLAVTGWKNALYRIDTEGLLSVHPGSGSVSAVSVTLPVQEFPEIPPGNALNAKTGSTTPQTATSTADWRSAADALRSELGKAGG